MRRLIKIPICKHNNERWPQWQWKCIGSIQEVAFVFFFFFSFCKDKQMLNDSSHCQIVVTFTANLVNDYLWNRKKNPLCLGLHVWSPGGKRVEKMVKRISMAPQGAEFQLWNPISVTQSQTRSCPCASAIQGKWRISTILYKHRRAFTSQAHIIHSARVYVSIPTLFS